MCNILIQSVATVFMFFLQYTIRADNQKKCPIGEQSRQCSNSSLESCQDQNLKKFGMFLSTGTDEGEVDGRGWSERPFASPLSVTRIINAPLALGSIF
jgi:hypothetical protein